MTTTTLTPEQAALAKSWRVQADYERKVAQEALAGIGQVAAAYAESTTLFGAKDVARLANTMAEAEGRSEVFKRAARALEQGGTWYAVQRTLMVILLGNPDDTYSGRNGDAARARMDGRRMAAEWVDRDIPND